MSDRYQWKCERDGSVSYLNMQVYDMSIMANCCIFMNEYGRLLLRNMIELYDDLEYKIQYPESGLTIDDVSDRYLRV